MPSNPKPSSRRKPGPTEPPLPASEMGPGFRRGDETGKVLVGIITGVHGIKGEVKLKSFTESPEAITSYGPLHTASGRTIEIGKLRRQKDGFIAALKNVRDRNAAEALKGTELFVPRAQLPELRQDEVYLSDLVGKPVAHNGSTLGRISGFQNFGAGELMELDTGLLIPVAFIGSAEETVVVLLPEEFLESNDKQLP